MNLILLLVAVGLAGASTLPGDKVCQPHSRPWQVRLHDDRFSCSGALINEWWLVTSFNCAPTSLTAIASLGEHDVTVEEGSEQHIHVADVVRHSPYRSPLHSLSMVRLAKPARFNQYVQPIPLPSQCPQTGDTCQVSGWGSTVPNNHESDQYLKCITVDVVNDLVCMNTLPEYMYWSLGMVCAGEAETDNCLDDRGSVLVCDGQLQGVQWLDQGCRDPADPTVYTKLCLYNEWINKVIDSYTPTTTGPTKTTTLTTGKQTGSGDVHS